MVSNRNFDTVFNKHTVFLLIMIALCNPVCVASKLTVLFNSDSDLNLYCHIYRDSALTLCFVEITWAVSTILYRY